MKDEQYQELKKELKEFLSGLIDKKTRNLERSLESVQKTVDTILSDLEQDRKDIGQFSVDLSKSQTRIQDIGTEVQHLKDVVTKSATKIVEKVADKMDTAMESVSDTVVDSVAPAVEKKLNNFIKSKPKIERKAVNVFGRILSWTR